MYRNQRGIRNQMRKRSVYIAYVLSPICPILCFISTDVLFSFQLSSVKKMNITQFHIFSLPLNQALGKSAKLHSKNKVLSWNLISISVWFTMTRGLITQNKNKMKIRKWKNWSQVVNRHVIILFLLLLLFTFTLHFFYRIQSDSRHKVISVLVQH